MSIDSIALFLHVVGASGMFVALGLEWAGLSQVRSAQTPEQLRSGMGALRGVRRFGFVAMMTTIVSGIYMMLTDWGGEGWIIVTIASLALVIALAQVVTAPRMAAIGRALFGAKGPSSVDIQGLARHPLLSISIHTRVAIVLGIVFLKTAKPDLEGSVLTIGVAIVLGIASSLPRSRRERVQATSTR